MNVRYSWGIINHLHEIADQRAYLSGKYIRLKNRYKRNQILLNTLYCLIFLKDIADEFLVEIKGYNSPHLGIPNQV